MKFLLPTINLIENKKYRINRISLNYNNSKYFGILYEYVDENKQKAINSFIKKLKNDGKKVDLLLAIEKNNADNRYFKTFKINEIGFLGNWKNNNVKSFIYQPYDFLIYLDLKIIPEMENILIKSLSRCRIGFSYNKLKILEMILKTENEFDIDYRLNKLYHYLKKIK